MAVQLPYMMRIPSEIRLQICSYLFNDKGQMTFEIRNEDPDVFKRKHSRNRTTYRVLGRDLMRQSQPTTYYLATNADLHPSIMAVNRQIHQETSYLLYGQRTFSFNKDIEAIVPFFSDLTKETRTLIGEVSLMKQGSVYSRDYDRCEWSNVCDCIRDDMRIGSLKLVVEGGRPSMGWAGLPKYSVSDFKTLSSVRYEALEWVWELLSIRGIKKLEVTSEIHRCPPSHSTAMAFFAAFSASIETGFSEFLHSELLLKM